jgi:hypothetical protein
VKTLAGYLPTLCEAMSRGERYIYKEDDGVFKLQCGSGTNSVVRMCQDKRFVTFILDDLRYLMNMIHLVQVQQTRYILARDEFVAYAITALRSMEFVEPESAVCGLILYDQLPDDLKTLLI